MHQWLTINSWNHHLVPHLKLVFWLYLSGLLPSVRTEVVDTDGGSVRGLTWPESGELISVYLGIPFAQPPIGALRFSPPIPRDPWRPAEWNATYFRPVCPQDLNVLRMDVFDQSFSDVSEDCLYLNVFTPRSFPGHDPRPVLVMIHGGSYSSGSARSLPAHELAFWEVVVVTVNYRLGVLGFLSTGSEEAPGNYGLLDQIEALNWVKRNIAAFGGDPNKVVIMGHGTGGISASILQFSPLGQGLFRGVVAQSGTALSPWAAYRPPYSLRSHTIRLAQQLGCLMSSDSVIVACLRNQSIVALQSGRLTDLAFPFPWAPVIDGHVIPDLPERLLERGQVERVPVMTGNVPDEVSNLDLAGFSGVEKGINSSDYGILIWNLSQLLHFEGNRDEIERELLLLYPVSPDPVANRKNLMHLNTDFAFVAPTIRLAEKLSCLNVSVWVYSFKHLPKENSLPAWMGVPHGEELYYVFGAPIWNGSCPGGCPRRWSEHQVWTVAEKILSFHMITMWVNFAKNLNPNTSTDVKERWQPYMGDGCRNQGFPARAYLLIDEKMTLKTDLEARQMHFWNKELLRSGR